MKMYCNRCHTAFTVFNKANEEATKKLEFAFSHGISDKMVCPNCGARNPQAKVASVKYQKHYRTRYQPKPRYATGDEDFTPPSIILHPDCQKRIMGSVGNKDGMRVVCDGCPQVFNCWTGNVDDGLCNVITEPSPKKVIIDAKKQVENQQKIAEEAAFQKMKQVMGKAGFCYEFKNLWYCKLGGTIWKLDPADVNAITSGAFNTKKTTVIKASLNNRGLSLSTAKSLLEVEIKKQNNV